MNLLINISNLRFGGGLSLAKNLLQELIPLRKDDNILLVYPQNCGYELLGTNEQVQLLPVPDRFHYNPIYKYLYNQSWLPRIAAKNKTDKIISLGNVAFPSGKTPQLVYIQNAWLLYPESLAWNYISTKSIIYNRLQIQHIRGNLKQASAFAFQTESMKERFGQLFPEFDQPSFIIPNAATSPAQSGGAVPVSNQRSKKLIMLSKFYGYKNFEVLIPLARLLRERNAGIEIYVTVDYHESFDADRFLEGIMKSDCHDIIHTLGHLPPESVCATLQQFDGLLHPSLLESYSGAYAEALRAGIPIFTSDLPFAHEVCGDAAFYFNPVDPVAIADSVVYAFTNQPALDEKKNASHRRGLALPGWKQIAEDFSGIIDRFE